MKVIIIDDDQLVSMSLKTILEASKEIEVIDIGGTGKEAIQLYEKHRPDIILLDIHMHGMDGLEAGKQILNTDPEARVLFLTTFSDDEYIIKALRLGAKGYIMKQNFKSILPALLAVQNGQTVFCSEITNRLPQLLETASAPDIDLSRYEITARENKIIQLVSEGLNNKEIAEKLFLSEGTVRNYISTILEKLELRDRTQLAVFYYRHLEAL
ncbi:MAG: response regulator transcription factor [Eubacteriales bacterium]|nr:response regulator transcription factor [Eubacteriales bacterium]